MRQSEIYLRPGQVHPGLGAADRSLLSRLKILILDVRALGVMLTTLIALVMLWTSASWPVQIASSQIARGVPGEQIWSFALSPSGRQIATTNSAGCVTLRAHHHEWQIERSLDFPGFAWAVAFSPDGRRLAALGTGPGICLWNLASSQREPDMLINVPIHRPKLLKFSPDGRFLAVTTTPHGTILVWDLKERREHMKFHHTSLVDSIAFSPNGHWLATAATNGPSITLCDLQTGSRQTLEGATSWPGNGDFLLSRWVGPGLGQCRRSSRSPLGPQDAEGAGHVLIGNTRSVKSIAFSPDQSLLATAGDDGTLALWNTATGERRVRADCQATCLITVTFSPDGRTLFLATGDDDDVRSWDVDKLLGSPTTAR